MTEGRNAKMLVTSLIKNQSIC